jgi:uncharacterized protein (DUF849 family)
VRRIAPLALVAGLLAGCGGTQTSEPAEPVTPGEYVELAEQALRGPARMAVLAGRQGGPTPGAAPARPALERLVSDSDAARERLAEARIEDAGLRRQRDAVVARQAAMVGVMRRLVDPLSRGDEGTLRARAPSLLALLRRLPSDVAAASPSR